MSDDPEIPRAARFLVQKYGADAETTVARCAETLLAKGELEGCSFVTQLLGALMELRRTAAASRRSLRRRRRPRH